MWQELEAAPVASELPEFHEQEARNGFHLIHVLCVFEVLSLRWHGLVF